MSSVSDIKFIAGKYVVTINGKKVSRTKKEHIDYVVRKAQEHAVDGQVVESRFTINERFGFLSDMVTMLAKGDQASVVVTGPGGLGKSHTISAALVKSGFKDLSTLDEYEVGAVVPPLSLIHI